jgi:hypothetical protein
MMTKLTTLGCVAILVTGCCEPMPVYQPFPAVSPMFMETGAPLKLIPIDGSATAADVFESVIDNYAIYHEQAAKLKGWQDWYAQQQAIYDKLNGSSSK